jgi:hypothetical protein
MELNEEFLNQRNKELDRTGKSSARWYGGLLLVNFVLIILNLSVFFGEKFVTFYRSFDKSWLGLFLLLLYPFAWWRHKKLTSRVQSLVTIEEKIKHIESQIKYFDRLKYGSISLALFLLTTFMVLHMFIPLPPIRQ